jgi:hypothetical protein
VNCLGLSGFGVGASRLLKTATLPCRWLPNEGGDRAAPVPLRLPTTVRLCGLVLQVMQQVGRCGWGPCEAAGVERTGQQLERLVHVGSANWGRSLFVGR